MRLFGTSGIRNVVDSWLIQLALKVGLSLGSIYHSIAVGCDTRTSSNAMKHALNAGLLVSGSKCYDVGIVPTPTLAFAAREFDAGAMVTASHNPPQYNGIKLLNPDGSAFDSRQQKQIEEMVSDESFHAASWDKISSGSLCNGAIEKHIERILKDFPDKLRLRIVVDCGCGAASVITPYLLRGLGCEVISLNCEPSGFFPRNAEPIEANLRELMQATKEFGADLGIAHDGDADRMMAVDDRGRFISGDKLMVIFAREYGVRDVVTTVDASMAIDEMGFNVFRTMVGDNYVSEELKKVGEFGGEPSGSWVFPGMSLCPDGIYAAARIAAIANRQKLSELADDLLSHPMLRGNVDSGGVLMSQLEPRFMAMEPLSVDHIDGIKLNFKDGWLLVRASGTEPKIRLTVEAKSEEKVRQLYNRGIEVIKKCVDGR